MPSTQPGCCSRAGSKFSPSCGLVPNGLAASEPAGATGRGAKRAFCRRSPQPTVLHLRAFADVLAVGVGLVVVRVVAAFFELEVELLAIVGVLQVAAKVADGGVGRFVDADQADLAGDVLIAAGEAEHRGDVDGRRHAGDVLAGDLADLLHVVIGVGDAVERAAFEDDVGEDAVDAILHLVGEAFHHGVDDDHRRDAEHHADDRDERDVASAEVAPAEEEFVHGPVRGF